MIFDEFHQEMDMMMDWNSNFWFYIIIGLIALVIIVIVIINLMNRSTKQEISSIGFDDAISKPDVNKKFKENSPQFCPGCGEKIADPTGKFCPLCGTQF